MEHTPEPASVLGHHPGTGQRRLLQTGGSDPAGHRPHPFFIPVEPPLARSTLVTWALCAGKGNGQWAPAAWAPPSPRESCSWIRRFQSSEGDGWLSWWCTLVGSHHLAIGSPVELTVDAEARRALSLGRSACHLVALALNRALTPLMAKGQRGWTLSGSQFRPPRHPALPGRAQRIKGNGYRIGKSLRKRESTAGTAGRPRQDSAPGQRAADARWLKREADPPQPGQ